MAKLSKIETYGRGLRSGLSSQTYRDAIALERRLMEQGDKKRKAQGRGFIRTVQRHLDVAEKRERGGAKNPTRRLKTENPVFLITSRPRIAESGLPFSAKAIRAFKAKTLDDAQKKADRLARITKKVFYVYSGEDGGRLYQTAKNPLQAIAKKAVKAVKKATKKAAVSLRQLQKNPPVMSVAQGSLRADVYPSGDKFMVAVPGEAPSGGHASLRAASTYAKARLAKLKQKLQNQGALLGVAGIEQVLAGRDSVTGKLMSKLGRRNPQEGAEKIYEVFHGLPSTQVLQYRTQEHVHEWLGALGTLTSLEVVRAGKKAPLRAPDPDEEDFDKVVMVCVAEDGKQIFFIGGDQSIPLDALGPKIGLTEDDVRDHMEIGRVHRLIYRTHKKFESKGRVAIDFYHDHGEEHAEGVLPILEYKPLNPSMELVGGRYKIAPFDKQLGASPGVVG